MEDQIKLDEEMYRQVGFEFLTTARMKIVVFWVVAPCRPVVEAAITSETSVNFYQSTRRYKPEDSHLQMYRHFVPGPTQPHIQLVQWLCLQG
jgi:hypothetical protein